MPTTKTTLNKSFAPNLASTLWNYTYRREILPNGLTLVEVAQPHLHSTAISLFVKVGSRFEAPQHNGLSHFLEHMLFRGTKRFPSAFELNVAFEKLGGTLAASTAADATEYSIALPVETTLEGLALLAEVIQHPLFQEIDVEKKIITEEIREDLDEHGNPVDIDFLSRKRLWPKHPLGQTITGVIDTINRIQLNDLRDWFEKYYVASNMVLCVSGAIDRIGVREKARSLFGRIPKGQPILPTMVPRLGTSNAVVHTEKPGSQTQIRLAFHALGLLDQDFVIAELLLRLLDDGMSTPIHRRIFEEKGLAYNVGADLEAYEDVGALNIDATCSHENVIAVLYEALKIASGMRNGLVSDPEMNKARDRALWDLQNYQDSPPAMNSWYGEQELFRRPKDLEYESKIIKAVTSSQIKSMARRIFTKENLVATTVGVQNEAQTKAASSLLESFKTD